MALAYGPFEEYKSIRDKICPEMNDNYKKGFELGIDTAIELISDHVLNGIFCDQANKLIHVLKILKKGEWI